MNDIAKSVWDWFKEKTSSPLYFTYIAFLIVWNWKFFYILFWEDSSLLSETKVEYVSTYFLNFQFGINGWQASEWQNVILNWILNVIWHIAPPALLTLLAVVYLPYIQSWAHKIYIKNYFERKGVYDIENLEYEKRKTARLSQRVAQKEEQKKQVIRLEKALTQEEKWLAELDRVSSNQNYVEAIRRAYNAVYKTNTRFSNDISSANTLGFTYISAEYLSRLDTLGLVDIKSSTINFTDKGKFFLKELQQQNKIF